MPVIGRGAAPTLRCPRCQAEAMPGGVFVTCRGCGLTFDGEAGMRPTERPRRVAEKPYPPLPERLKVTDDGEVLLYCWTWRRWPAPLLGSGAAAVGWAGFAVGGTGALLAAGALLAGLAGLAAAFAVNRTILRVDHDAITVSDRPIRLGGDQVIPAADIGQLHVVERFWGRGGRYYVLHATLRDGQVRSVAYVESVEMARYLEERIEERLGIVDVTVDGEVDPP